MEKGILIDSFPYVSCFLWLDAAMWFVVTEAKSISIHGDIIICFGTGRRFFAPISSIKNASGKICVVPRNGATKGS